MLLLFQNMGYAPDFVFSISPYIKDISKKGKPYSNYKTVIILFRNILLRLSNASYRLFYVVI